MPYFYTCRACQKLFEPPFETHESQLWVDACHEHNEEGEAVCWGCLGVPISDYITLEKEGEDALH